MKPLGALSIGAHALGGLFVCLFFCLLLSLLCSFVGFLVGFYKENFNEVALVASLLSTGVHELG